MRLRHVFTAGAQTRTLPVDDLPDEYEVLQFEGADDEAPGGPTDANGRVSRAEYDAHQAVYQRGARWTIFDDDDAGRCIWGGVLADPMVGVGDVRLHADGYGKKPDDRQRQRLWRSYDLDRFTAGDSQPHDYDQDRKITAKVDGARIVLGWEKGTRFAKNKAGAPAAWASGVAGWWPGRDLNSIRFHYRKQRSAPAVLDVLRAQGPTGGLFLVDSIDLSQGPLEGDFSAGLGGDQDLVYLRLKRTQGGDGKARPFSVVITDLSVGGLAPAAGNHTASEVVEDIVASYGESNVGIGHSPANMMPLEQEDEPDGAILDEAALLAGYYWRRAASDNGAGVVWEFRPWGARTWHVTDPHVEPEVDPLPRWNVVTVPHRHPGGQRDQVRARANPDPFPGEDFVFRFALDDPLPPIDVATAFGLNAADALAEQRFIVSATLHDVEDAQGATVPASRIRSGDVVIFDLHGGIEMQVARTTYEDHTRISSAPIQDGPTGHPLLDRIIARRRLALARGRHNAAATLGGFDINDPQTPEGLVVGIQEVDRRVGRSRFDAILDWDAVTEDIDGNGTVVKRYVAQLRYTDSAGDPIAGLDIEQRSIRRNRDDDPAPDLPIPTRVRFKRLLKPHRYYVQMRVGAVDFEDRSSDMSEWTPPVRPAAFGPPTPTGLTLDTNNRGLQAEWDSPDPEENESGGGPMIDRRVAYARVERFRADKETPANFVKRGKTNKVKTTSKSWRTPGARVGDRWRVEVTNVDGYGNVSGTASATITVDTDPSHKHGADGHTHGGGGHKHGKKHKHGGGSHKHGKKHKHSHAHQHKHGKKHKHSHSGHHHGKTHKHGGGAGHKHNKNHKHGGGGGHSHGKNHKHGHSSTHKHGKSHSHGGGTHRHTWGHGHPFSRHTGHGHSFTDNTHGHGGATAGFSANPGGVGNHNHVINTATHDHTFTTGGGHAHGQTSDDAGDAGEGTYGASPRAADTNTMQEQSPGTASDFTDTGFDGPGDSDFDFASTTTESPGDTSDHFGDTSTDSTGDTADDFSNTSSTTPPDSNDDLADTDLETAGESDEDLADTDLGPAGDTTEDEVDTDLASFTTDPNAATETGENVDL